MNFWRKDVVEFALDHETEKHVAEQREWILREPENPVPYFNLAQLRRMQWKAEEGLALLLEAVRLNPDYAEAHVALAELYAVKEDYRMAWKHAEKAEAAGACSAMELLKRYNAPKM